MIGPLPTAIANPDAPAGEGQVEVAEGVALADSVVLEAAPGCRLVLAPGVCVGSGVIIHAVRGDVVIEPGAVLGHGVLIFGAGHIGRKACIGAESTLINPVIASNQVVPPNSLLGDPSQTSRDSTSNSAVLAPDGWVQDLPTQEVLVQATLVQETLVQETLVQTIHPETPSENPTDLTDQPLSHHAEEAETENQGVSTTGLASEPTEDFKASNGTRPPAHGQRQVQDLLAKLFPHRQPLNGVTSGGVSPEDKP